MGEARFQSLRYLQTSRTSSLSPSGTRRDTHTPPVSASVDSLPSSVLHELDQSPTILRHLLTLPCVAGLQKAREGARTDKRNRQQALASVLSQSTNAVASTSGLSSSEKLYYKILRCWPMPLTELFEPQYQPRYTDVDISPYDGKWVKKRCDSDDWPEDVLTELLNLTKRSGMGRQAAFKARDLVIGMMGRRRRSRGPKHEVEGMIVEDVREARRLWE